MKLGDLGSILKKEPLELAKAYNLAENVETLEDDVLTNILKSEIIALDKSIKDAAKKDVYGFAERKVKEDIEKRLKSEFGVDGENLESLFEGIKTKIQPHDPKSDEKTKFEIEQLKKSKEKIESEFNNFKLVVESKEKKNSQFAIFDKHFSNKFDVKSERLKQLAFDGFFNDYEIEKGETTDYVIDRKTNKPISESVEDLILKAYKDDFPIKGEKSNPSPLPGQYDPTKTVSMGTTNAELLEELRSEKDPVRRQQINEKIKALSKKN